MKTGGANREIVKWWKALTNDQTYPWGLDLSHDLQIIWIDLKQAVNRKRFKLRFEVESNHRRSDCHSYRTIKECHATTCKLGTSV